MAESVLCDVDGAVATITLNRPAARNAMTVEMKVALLEALRSCAADEAVRAVILTGTGKAFCSGQDLREHADLLDSGQRPTDTVGEHYNPIIAAITTMPKPVIAAVNGVAAGAGASLAFACDFRVAAREASVLMAFARVGLGPDSGASWTLQRLAGLAAATELLMLAEPVSADRALALGLFTQVADGDDLADAAQELAARLAAGPTAAYAGIKEALSYAATHDLPAALAREDEIQTRLGGSRDHAAATRAFVQKQTPVYEGK